MALILQNAAQQPQARIMAQRRALLPGALMAKRRDNCLVAATETQNQMKQDHESPK